MSSKRIEKRCKIKPFIKQINYNHLLPTRYLVSGELDLKPVVSEEKLGNAEDKKKMKLEIKKMFQE